MPRTCELNVDHIVFTTYHAATECCRITKGEIEHLQSPCFTQSQIGYSLDGLVRYTENELHVTRGAVCRSWPVESRLRAHYGIAETNKKNTIMRIRIRMSK